MTQPETETREYEAFVVEIRGKIEQGPMEEYLADAFCQAYNRLMRRLGRLERALKRRVYVSWRFADDDGLEWDDGEPTADSEAGE